MAMENLPEPTARLIAELEFVQCLSSPSYLHFLAQKRYFDDPAFMNFLRYLKYWKKPEYAQHIAYPHCLQFLDMVTDESATGKQFIAELAKREFQDFVHEQQFYHWQHHLNNRRKEFSDSNNPDDKT
mmetsp:Transcript_6129/g.7605  ORF Transcript_6129/g.7605 Transcript_6129/m.7605 type:complete len:127 (-) Transcript_6129:477-857(-)|eukprot:CAMPEP_0185773826 /NCGR_PEP_ID=MMETSP1174-20130828/75248_1 /TAXON_ID=35687 /ORGANISM="Dictyocha speculum, Strain CCMP1381" /LENGTH=126 /DNA_ID=CAMNT_0028460687 /DNA_START=92 /DNA_END=472 /DNA_ORIENTATION=+